jgi:serine O-acetyltransferase
LNSSREANGTIGLRNEKAFPGIADDVYIGAGTRVLCEIYVGNPARIGANAVVIEDIPAVATVVGPSGLGADKASKAKIIQGRTSIGQKSG